MKKATTRTHSPALGIEEHGRGVERLVGLLGDPVAHTLSPAMQNAAFQALGAHCRYLAFRVSAENFESAIQGLSALGAVGSNITVPHKERAFRWVRRLDPSAAGTGAVNTVLFSEEGAVGYNTDVAGIRTALAALSPRKGSALILGSGGAARAAVCALQDEGFAHIGIMNRTRERAETLRTQFFPTSLRKPPTCEVLSFGEAPSFTHDLLVNTTSLGMHGAPWPEELLDTVVSAAKGGAVLDLVYARGGETPLCERARISGIRALSGQEVLLHQGTAAFKLFTGLAAPVEVMKEALRKATS